jgi:hypothetical protein
MFSIVISRAAIVIAIAMENEHRTFNIEHPTSNGGQTEDRRKKLNIQSDFAILRFQSHTLKL